MKFRKIILPLAIAVFSAFQLYGQTYRSYLRKANDQFELKAYSQAIESYKEVLSRKGDEMEALEKIALCYASLNNMDEAADNLTKLVRQRTVDARVFLQFGTVLKALGRYEEAKSYFLLYARTDPTKGNHFAQSCDFALAQRAVQSDYAVVEERVNSLAADFGPAFYREQVVFSSSRTAVQRTTDNWDGISRSQFFISRLGADGYLQPAAILKTPAPGNGEGPVSFSGDGRKVAYTKNNFVDGVRQIPENDPQLSIFLADINEQGEWVNERSFIHNAGGRTGYPGFTSDGSALFFASDRPDGFGGYDLYISYFEGGAWTKPINLGPVVNTPGNEISPYFDGTNLYFSSDWHAGFGGMDIFMAESGDGRWTKVSNVGMPINSSRDDYGFIFDNFRNYGLFVSNRPGGRGKEDLYHIHKGGETTMMLRIVNATDRMPVQGATVDLSDCAGQRKILISDSQGQCPLPVGTSLSCSVVVTMPGFQEARVPISASSAAAGRDIEVALIRTTVAGAGAVYQGLVLNRATNTPLSGVEVYARNVAQGTILQAVTDFGGKYSLTLSPNTTYSITYAARGYQEYTKTVNTFTGQDRNLLGTAYLISTGAGSSTLSTPETGNIPQTMAGFSVQVASMSMIPEMPKYAPLKAVGNVYSVLDKGAYKVRVGPFKTREEAAAKVPQVKRYGYSGAFVVAEGGAPVTSNSVPGTTPNTTVGTRPIEPQTSDGQIMIQLGAYSNVKYFDSARANLIGPVVDRVRGNLTIKLITGFFSLDEARRSLPTARQAGFKDAFIVQERNGALVKIL